MKWILRGLVALGLLALPAVAHGTTWTVTSNAEMTNTNANALAGDKINIKAGTYSVAPNPAHSGTSSARIVYAGVGGNRAAVVITGGMDCADSNVTWRDMTFQSGGIGLGSSSGIRRHLNIYNVRIIDGTFQRMGLVDSRADTVNCTDTRQRIDLLTLRSSTDTTTACRRDTMKYCTFSNPSNIGGAVGSTATIIWSGVKESYYEAVRCTVGTTTAQGSSLRFFRFSGQVRAVVMKNCYLIGINNQANGGDNEPMTFSFKDGVEQCKFYADTIIVRGNSNSTSPFISFGQAADSGPIGSNTIRDCYIRNETNATWPIVWVYEGWDGDSIVGNTFVAKTAIQSYYSRGFESENSNPTIVDHNIFAVFGTSNCLNMQTGTANQAVKFRNNIFYNPTLVSTDSASFRPVYWGAQGNWGTLNPGTVGPIANDSNVVYAPNFAPLRTYGWSGGAAYPNQASWRDLRGANTLDVHSKNGTCLFANSSFLTFDPHPQTGSAALWDGSGVYSGPFGPASVSAPPDPCQNGQQPAAVTDFAGSVLLTTATLTWTSVASTPDVDNDGGTRWVLYRGLAPATSSMSAIDSAASTGSGVAVTRTDATMAQDTPYYYNLRYFNAQGQIACYTTSIGLRSGHTSTASVPNYPAPIIAAPQGADWGKPANWAGWPFQNTLGQADPTTVALVARYNTVGLSAEPGDSLGPYGAYNYLHTIAALRAANPALSIYGYAHGTSAYRQDPSSPIYMANGTVAKDTTQKYYYLQSMFKAVRVAGGGWTTGSGLTGFGAPVDSTGSNGFFWNSEVGKKGWFWPTTGTASGNTLQNVNIAYRTGGTYLVVDSLVNVYDKYFIMRTDENGNYLYDGLFLDGCIETASGYNLSGFTVDHTRAGYATAALLDSAVYDARRYMFAQLRARAVADGRPNFAFVANSGAPHVAPSINAWTWEYFPTQSGGTWLSNLAWSTSVPLRQPGVAGVALGPAAEESWYTASARVAPWVSIFTASADSTLYKQTAYRRTVTNTMASLALTNSATLINGGPGCGSPTGDGVWWFDEFAVDTTTGNATFYNQSKTGWLGYPIGYYYNNDRPTSLTDRIGGPGTFTQAGNRNVWGLTTISGTTASFPTVTTDSLIGGSSIVCQYAITTMPVYSAGNPQSGQIQLRYLNKIYATTGHTYTISFRAKASIRRPVRFVFSGKTSGVDRSAMGNYPIWISNVGGNFMTYKLPFTVQYNAATTESCEVAFYLGDTTGTVQFDDIRLYDGVAPSSYIRRFQHGFAVYNNSSVADTVTFDVPVRHINSNFGAKLVNDGAIFNVGNPVVVPANTGQFLIHYSAAPTDPCIDAQTPSRIVNLTVAITDTSGVTPTFRMEWTDGTSAGSYPNTPDNLDDGASIDNILITSYPISDNNVAGITPTDATEKKGYGVSNSYNSHVARGAIMYFALTTTNDLFGYTSCVSNVVALYIPPRITTTIVQSQNRAHKSWIHKLLTGHR